jgi:NAD(P)H-hydrate repair Nnr-like enzyme with NAD(P)H-hydrate epimerase domain
MTERVLFAVEGTGISVPTLTVEEAARVRSLAFEHYGVQPVQVAENLGRSLADLAVRLGGGGIAAGLRALVLVGAAQGGLGAAVAARHLVNRGARVTVLFDRPPRALPQLHKQLGSMLTVLGLELQVADPEDVGLYLPENAPYDVVLDGLGGADAPAALPAPADRVVPAVLAGLRGAHVAVLSVDCPTGVDPATGAAGADAVEALATLAAGFPLTTAAAARHHFGALWLSDVSYPAELAAEVGHPIAPVFATGALVPLVAPDTVAVTERGDLDV